MPHGSPSLALACLYILFKHQHYISPYYVYTIQSQNASPHDSRQQAHCHSLEFHIVIVSGVSLLEGEWSMTTEFEDWIGRWEDFCRRDTTQYALDREDVPLVTIHEGGLSTTLPLQCDVINALVSCTVNRTNLHCQSA